MNNGLLHKFNAQRPGSLVGIIYGLLEYLRFLYVNIGEVKEEHGSANQYSTCPACKGAGIVRGDIDPSRMIAPELSLKRGAVLLWAGTNCGPVVKIRELANRIGIDYEQPLIDQDKPFIDILLYGYDREPVVYTYKKEQRRDFYRGCVFDLTYMRDKGTTSKGNLRAIALFSRYHKCPDCNGKVAEIDGRIMGHTLSDVLNMPISESLQFVQKVHHDLDNQILDNYSTSMNEIELHLTYLHHIGLQSLSAFDIAPLESLKGRSIPVP